MINASSKITFTGSNTFKNNTAMNGGAISLYYCGSVLIMQADGANCPLYHRCPPLRGVH